MSANLEQQQLPLCCPCGSPDLYRRGLCESCYNRGRRDRHRFAGKREGILSRDPTPAASVTPRHRSSSTTAPPPTAPRR